MANSLIYSVSSTSALTAQDDTSISIEYKYGILWLGLQTGWRFAFFAHAFACEKYM